jgi:hypothetical protein
MNIGIRSRSAVKKNYFPGHPESINIQIFLLSPVDLLPEGSGTFETKKILKWRHL